MLTSYIRNPLLNGVGPLGREERDYQSQIMTPPRHYGIFVWRGA
jgi:hypothetical protein